MKKNFTRFILTLALALLLLPTKTFASDTATITVSDAKAKAGETAEMVILVETDSGVSGAGLTVEYNTTALTLTDIRSLASGTFLEDIDYASFSWLRGENISGSFELAVLCFEVDASAGGDYTVEVKPIGDLAANITNEMASPVATTFVPGILSVVKEDDGGVKDPATDESDGSGTGEDLTKDHEDDSEKDSPSTPEENKPQTTPTENPEKTSSNIGLYVAVIAVVAVGFIAVVARKKRK